MAYRETTIGLQARVNPGATARAILAELRARGDLELVAAHFGITRRQLDRLVNRLKIREKVVEIRARQRKAAKA